MKFRFVIALAALVLTTTFTVELFAQKKRYEPVVRQNLKDYVGKYTGIEPDYVVEIEVTTDGKLKVSDIEGGQTVALTNLKLTGARLTADKLYADGRTGKFDATFNNRIKNGQSTFGLRVDCLDIHLDGGFVITRLFYQRN